MLTSSIWRTSAGFGVSNGAASITIDIGIVNSGDLCVNAYLKDQASNFTMTASWQKLIEVATNGFAAAIFYKWGLAVDSGDNVVCSCSNGVAGQLGVGWNWNYRNVNSAANPFQSLTWFVESSSTFRTPSYTAPVNSLFITMMAMMSDDVVPNSAAFGANSWFHVNSFGTTTGNDAGAKLARRLSLSSVLSGDTLLPSSMALAAGVNYISFVWGVAGFAELTSQTRDENMTLSEQRFAQQIKGRDDGLTLTSPAGTKSISLLSNDRAALTDQRFFSLDKTRDDGLTLSTGGMTRVTYITASELLTLIDQLSRSSGAPGTIYTRLIDDVLIITDGVQQWALYTRQATELTALNDFSLKQLTLLRGDLVTLIDDALKSSIFSRVISDGTPLADYMLRQLKFLRSDVCELNEQQLASKERVRIMADSLRVIDDQLRTVKYTRLLDDALTLRDEIIEATKRIIIRVMSDAIEISDDVQKVVLSVRQIGDSLQLIEALDTSTVRGRVFSDVVLVLADALQTSVVRNRISTDSLSLMEVTHVSASRNRMIEEMIDVTDSLGTSRLLTRVIDDTLQIEDFLEVLYLSVAATHASVRGLIGLQTLCALGLQQLSMLGVEHDLSRLTAQPVSMLGVADPLSTLGVLH